MLKYAEGEILTRVVSSIIKLNLYFSQNISLLTATFLDVGV